MTEKVFQEEFKTNIICEIGGGFGSFSSVILNKYKNLKLLLIDLPEANLMSSYYLSSLFPNKKFFLFDDFMKCKNFDKHIFKEYDYVILPPICLEKFNNLGVDLFINTSSMMEMKPKIIKNYFKFIESNINLNGFFLNINRYEKNTQNIPIRIAEYPYDKNWKVISSYQLKENKNIHLLLTQRSHKENHQDILHELKKIDNFGKQFYKSTLKNLLIIN